MNGPESNNLPGLGSGHRICTYVYREFENEKRKLAWYDGGVLQKSTIEILYFYRLRVWPDHADE